LVANPDYFGGRPYTSRVVYRIIPSQATIFLELKAKGVDSAGLTALQFKRQTEYPAFRKAYHKYEYSANAYTYLGFNLKDPRFADRRVRQAFAYAINKRELIDGVLLGLGREATGPYKTGPDELNQISYANPEVDALLEQGRTSCHQEERKKSYARLQEILAEDQPIVFLYFRDALPVVSSRVRGIVPSANGILYNFNEW